MNLHVGGSGEYDVTGEYDKSFGSRLKAGNEIIGFTFIVKTPGSTTVELSVIDLVVRDGDKDAAVFVDGVHVLHSWTVTDGTDATCTADGFQNVVCSVCGISSSLTVPALGHDFGDWEETVPVTCTVDGEEAMICSRCGERETRVLTAPGHDFGEWTATVPVSCTADGEETRICLRCGGAETRAVPSTGHDYTAAVTEPTCTDQGFTTHVCTKCGDSYTDRYVEMLGHGWGEWVPAAEASCTADGEEARTCSRCGETETRPIASPGHDYNVKTTAPTCKKRGYTTHTCSRCGDSFTDSYAASLGHDFGSDGKAEKCLRCGAKNPAYYKPTGFEDVPDGAYYTDPVAWAVENDVTAGTSPTRFSPESGCTRAQVVTFLWRAAGEPEPECAENPFTDVKEDDYFFKAVLWAVENGITKGTGKNKFSPSGVCTRGQIVTFLWRAGGQPEPECADNPFTDVKEDDYFFKAVLWAVENGITNGTSPDAFSPGNTCTRAQVVTFIWRDIG